MKNQFASRTLRDTPSARPRVPQKLPLRPRYKAKFENLALGDRLRAFKDWIDQRGRKKTAKQAGLGLGGLFVLYFLFLWITLPSINNIGDLIPAQSSVIVDRNGVELYRLYSEEDRTIIPDSDIPEYLKKAVVAIEDERFYDRGCIDMRAMARVVFRFGQAGGASTLTRQLARNALSLKQDNIINRKIKEVILGCRLESRYTKEELLSLYLNWIPFGQNAYGIEQASRRYFGKGAKELTLAESAVLASLPQRPSYFSPYGKNVRTSVSQNVLDAINSGRITKASEIPDDDVRIGLLGQSFGSGAVKVYIGGRGDQVLKNMQEQGLLSEAERLQALNDMKTLTFQASRESIRAPHFVLWVRKQVEDMLAEGAEEGFLDQGGLTIETTLDWKLQQAAEAAVNAKKDDYAKLYGANNIALVAADPDTKEILAYVGNVDDAEGEHDGKVDMAATPRQPGSSFKPFVYATAFEKGYAPATVLYDVPIKVGPDEPQNFDARFWGLMSARTALGASRNIPVIQAFFLGGGEEAVLNMATRLGAVSPEIDRETQREQLPDYAYGWPLAIGAAELPLTEMVDAYATLADGGKQAPLISIRRIKDRRGNIVPIPIGNVEKKDAVDPRIAYQITSILSDVSARPNEYWQNVLSVPGFQAAAKTGTSNQACPAEDRKNGTCRIKPNNLWTMGYTPNIVAGVWVGNADSTALSEKAESLITAAPIWKDFMVRAHKSLDNSQASFVMPSGLVQPQISTLSGELPAECTPITHRKSDVFRDDKAPTLTDPSCVMVEVDKVTGLLASDSCPVEAREMRAFFVPRGVLSDRYPQWEAAVQSWAAKTGTGLPLPLLPKEKCDISLTPGRLVKPTLSIEYPRSGGSATYPSFAPKLDFTGSMPREVIYEIDGKIISRVADTPFDPPLRVPKSISESGNHKFKVTLIDEYYNEVSDEVTFSFQQDSSAPNVRFLDPDDGDTLKAGSGVQLRAQAEDGEGGIKYVQFFVDEALQTTKPQEPYEIRLTLKPGEHTLKVTATDFAGNSASDEIDVTVEE